MDRCMFINVPWIKQHNPLHYERVHIRTEPHHPWEDLPGAIHHTNPRIHCVQSDTTGPTAVVFA